MNTNPIARMVAAGWFSLLALALLPMTAAALRIGLAAACNGAGGGCG